MNIAYTGSSIKILKGLQAVRRHPGMYIGNVEDDTGLHKMLFELIDNSIDEASAGFCDTIKITIYEDCSVSVEDNGRGIPVDYIVAERKSAAEIVLTVLHSGSKFETGSYTFTGGLHGVGLSVVNALSKYLDLVIWRDSVQYIQSYQKGTPVYALIVCKKVSKSGTYVHFLPDFTIFKYGTFIIPVIIERLNELAFLNNTICFVFSYFCFIQKKMCTKIIKFFCGLLEYLNYICPLSNVLGQQVFHIRNTIQFDFFEVAFCWSTSSFGEKILCFTNNIFQVDGGSHLTGFKNAVTKSVLHCFSKLGLARKVIKSISGDDIREGLFAIVSMTLKNPRFSSQTKDKLVASSIKNILEHELSFFIIEQLLSKIMFTKVLADKISLASRARLAAKTAREITRSKVSFEFLELPRVLADCHIKQPTESEIFIVEGDSAGGSAKQARTRKNQAILPLKGKILNVEKASFEKILLNDEIKILILSLGCGFGKNEYNFKKLRYHTIILMTDADVDGSHIRTLLLAFFFRYMPELFINGHIFISKPPLYSVNLCKRLYYFSSLFAVKKFLFWCVYGKFLEIFVTKNNFVKQILFEFLITFSKRFINYYLYIEEIFLQFSNYFSFELLFLVFSFPEYISFSMLKDYTVMILYIERLKLYLKNFEDIILLKEIILTEINDCWVPSLTLVKKNTTFEINFSFFFFFSNEFFCLHNVAKEMFTYFFQNKILLGFLKTESYTFSDIISFFIDFLGSFVFLQRYKGLGEMNPEQLWETSMDCTKRSLQIVMFHENYNDSTFVFNVLMGTNIRRRKYFIETAMISF